MKRNISARLLIAACLCLIMLLTFTACKDEEVFAETSDFESYPDYWNDFNDTEDDIYIPNSSDSTGSEVLEAPDFSLDDEDDTSSKVDTDGDGKPNDSDTDIDGDGIKNEADSDIDGDGTENDKDNDKDGDGTTNEGDLTPDGPSEKDDNGKMEGPLVPLK